MAHQLDQIRLNSSRQPRDRDKASGPRRDTVRQAGPAPELTALVPPMARPAVHRLPNSALRRLAGEDAYAVSDNFQQELQAERGGGRPLDQATSQGFGATLDSDLSGIRVHTGSEADHLASAIQARAFTHGRDIFFADGEFKPQSERGQFTLAHELAHATDAQDRAGGGPSGRLMVGSAHDPAEARADATAHAALQALRRQEMPAEDHVQALRRQEDTQEEEELQALRRQEDTQEEEELQALRRQPEEEEEEVQALRRQGPDVAMGPEGGPVATLEELDRQCERELGRLQRWMLSPGGMALQTLRAFDSSVGSWIDHMSIPDVASVGLQPGDIFSASLHLIPGAGPVARWIGGAAVRSAMVATAIQTTKRISAQGAAESQASGTRNEAGARADFASTVRAASAGMADTLARNVDSVLQTYENGIDAALQAGDSDALRRVLAALESENEQVRSVGPEQYREVARRFEIELYREFCLQTGATLQSREYQIAYQDEALELGGIVGLPHAAQQRLIRELKAADDILALGRSWGLPESANVTDLPAHGPM